MDKEKWLITTTDKHTVMLRGKPDHVHYGQEHAHNVLWCDKEDAFAALEGTCKEDGSRCTLYKIDAVAIAVPARPEITHV